MYDEIHIKANDEEKPCNVCDGTMYLFGVFKPNLMREYWECEKCHAKEEEPSVSKITS